VCGDDAVVDGSRIATWAILSNADDSILAAGVTLGMEIVQDLLTLAAGTGPAGAIASLRFPDVVRQATYFEHVEIQLVPQGHTISPSQCNPDYNLVPQFDFHFYSIPEGTPGDVWPDKETVFAIPAMSKSELLAQGWLDPDAGLLPAGYLQPGASIYQMGRHSAPEYVQKACGSLRADMLAGFLPDASKMHFIEPMISQARLLQREAFELLTPMPYELESFGRSFGRSMLYPRKFEARFLGNAWAMIFSDFISVPFTPAP
jgi:hypothetical protein